MSIQDFNLKAQCFESILNTTTQGFVFTDQNGIISSINPAFTEIFGYDEHKIIGKPYEILFFKDQVRQKITSQKPLHYFYSSEKTTMEMTAFDMQGNDIPIRFQSVLIRDEHDHIIQAVGIIESIATYKDADEGMSINEKMWEAQQNFENLLNNSADAIIISDINGNIVMSNKAFTEMLDYTQEEVIEKHIVEFSAYKEGSYITTTGDNVIIDERYIADTASIPSELNERGCISNWERYLARKDEVLVPVEITMSVLKGKDGERRGTVIISRDITNRKIVEKEIREARDFFENTFNTSADGIMVTDSQGCIVRVNRAIEQMLGFREDELIGKYTNELGTQSEESKKAITVMLEELFEKGFVNNFEALWYRKDRSLCPIETNITFIKDKEGNLSGSVGAIRDITERKKAEEELTKSKDHLNDIIESSLDAILVSDETGHITKANKYFQELLGFTEDELLGKHVTELTLMDDLNTYESTTGELVKIDENYVDDAWTKISRLHEEGKVSNWESYYFRKDRKVVPVEQNIVHLFDTKGGKTGSVAIIRDITGRKKMEQQLLQSKKLQSLGELAGGVAHDFNNVLAAILGRVQLLKTRIKPPIGKQEKRKSMLELLAALEIIEKASLDGAETVRRIQEFSRRRIDDKDFVQINLNELIDNALEFTKMKWKSEAEAKGMTIKIKKEFSPLIHAMGSPSELREVFTNLFNNAIDAMPQGGEIRLKTLIDNDLAVIKIEDTGGGISKEVTDRIFDPFFTTKGVRSTGLGLSVSYGIIKRHRGAITVDSIEGEGTEFTVKFPIIKKTDKGNGKKEKVIPINVKQKRARILVIDDEADVRELIRDILIDGGNDVEIAENGSKGIEMFEKKAFDLVFTDLGMPVMSGWEVAEKIKSINKQVPIAMITGWNITLDRSEMNDKGINLLIQKPFKMEQVLNLVQEGMVLRDQLKAV